MKTCATCRHWEKYDEKSDWWCGDENVERPHGRSPCNRITMIGDEARPVPKEELAHVQDGSQYAAVLYTKAEFGCVLHDEK